MIARRTQAMLVKAATPAPRQPAVCSTLSQRRDKIARILDQQITIAKKLSRENDRQFSLEARFAWEIVEELSAKLNKVNRQLDDCVCDNREYYAKMDLDQRLSDRMYDI